MALALLKKDAFGNFLFLKKAVIALAGAVTYRRYKGINRMQIEGEEVLKDLPENGVLFLSNHQTYYADVIAFYHIFCSHNAGQGGQLRNPTYLFKPWYKAFFVAAEETMKSSGIIPRVLSYAGAVTVQRSWRSQGENVNRQVDLGAVDHIHTALESGWVVSFPQGTTSPYAPIRKGVAHIIRDHKPIVVPIVIDGFRRAFDKRGLRFKKRGVRLSVRFKAPLDLTYTESVDELQLIIRDAIEQKDVMAKIRAMREQIK